MTKIITQADIGGATKFLIAAHEERGDRRLVLHAFPTLAEARAFRSSRRKAPRGATREGRQHWLRLFRLAFETCARRPEVARACWNEFDLEGRVWRLPLARRPGGHRKVPLSAAAVRVLKVMKLVARDDTPRVFHAIADDWCSEVMFRQTMFRLGLKCKGYEEFRRLAIERYEALNLKPAPSTVLKALGRTKANPRHWGKAAREAARQRGDWPGEWQAS